MVWRPLRSLRPLPNAYRLLHVGAVPSLKSLVEPQIPTRLNAASIRPRYSSSTSSTQCSTHTDHYHSEASEVETHNALSGQDDATKADLVGQPSGLGSAPGTEALGSSHPEKSKEESLGSSEGGAMSSGDYERMSEISKIGTMPLGNGVYLEEDLQPVRTGWRSILSYKFEDDPAGPITVAADGPDPTLATQAAISQLVKKFAELGRRTEGLPIRRHRTTTGTMSSTRQDLVDIYNYCAKYVGVPSVRTSTKKKDNGQDVAFEVSVNFSEQKISVTSGFLPTLREAESAVVHKFKEDVECFQAQEGASSPALKGHGYLSTANVCQFFAFYRRWFPDAGVQLIDMHDERIDSVSHAVALHVGDQQVGPTVHADRRHKASVIAHLAAAIILIRRELRLLLEFLFAPQEAGGKSVPELGPTSLPISGTAIMHMRNLLVRTRRERRQGLGFEPDEETNRALEANILKVYQRYQDLKLIANRSAELSLLKRQSTGKCNIRGVRDARADLPISRSARHVVEIIKENQYSVITGATGSGKTTQVPQILLDDYIKEGKGGNCNVICTQPRRIAATSVAEWVAKERQEPLTETVGFHVKNVSRRALSPGSINYCTTGVLASQLRYDPDSILDSVSHIIIDEVHERDVIVDFLMTLLRKLIAQRLESGKRVPKVVLMSATLDTSVFASYFGSVDRDGSSKEAPILNVPGQTFPTTEKYLDEILADMHAQSDETLITYLQGDRSTSEYLAHELKVRTPDTSQYDRDMLHHKEGTRWSAFQWQQEAYFPKSQDEELVESVESIVPTRLIVATAAHIMKTSPEGAILIFVPGLDEIEAVEAELCRSQPLGVDFSDETKYSIFKLHSAIKSSGHELFGPPRLGQRKIVIATNVVETSVTIPNVQFVIDCGKHKEAHFDESRRISTLRCTWISRSSTRQRAGRAGRLQGGHYLGLFTKKRLEGLPSVTRPEIQRADLQKLCLDVLDQKCDISVHDFFAQAIDPPGAYQVEGAIDSLRDLGAINRKGNLTSLGQLLSPLPLHPNLGKQIILGIIFRCLDPMIILASANSHRSLFVTSAEDPDRCRRTAEFFAANSLSDHMAIFNAFGEVRAVRNLNGELAARDFASRNNIHWSTFLTIDSTAREIEKGMIDSGLISECSAESENQFGGFYMNQNSSISSLIGALVLARAPANIAVRSADHTLWRSISEFEVATHPSSVNAEKTHQLGRAVPKKKTFAVYDHVSQSGDGDRLLIRSLSIIPPLSVCLFSRNLAAPQEHIRSFKYRNHANTVVADSWMPFVVRSRVKDAAQTIQAFRKSIDYTLTSAYGELAMRRHRLAQDPTPANFVETIVELLESGQETFKNLPRWSHIASKEEKRSSLQARLRGMTQEQEKRGSASDG